MGHMGRMGRVGRVWGRENTAMFQDSSCHELFDIASIATSDPKSYQDAQGLSRGRDCSAHRGYSRVGLAKRRYLPLGGRPQPL